MIKLKYWITRITVLGAALFFTAMVSYSGTLVIYYKINLHLLSESNQYSIALLYVFLTTLTSMCKIAIALVLFVDSLLCAKICLNKSLRRQWKEGNWV